MKKGKEKNETEIYETLEKKYEEEIEELDGVDELSDIDIITMDEEENEPKQPRNYKLISRILNIIFIIIMVSLVLVAIDVIAVGKYNVGPFFAIKGKTYKDGGTKVYYGLGYKVIKYHQTQGRRDMEIGSWSLKYNSNPIPISALDLSIEFLENTEEAYSKYYKKFIRTYGTIEKIDQKNHKMEIAYNDPDGKYTIKLTCTMAEKKKIDANIGDEIYVIGKFDDYRIVKGTQKIKIVNCFAEK